MEGLPLSGGDPFGTPARPHSAPSPSPSPNFPGEPARRPTSIESASPPHPQPGKTPGDYLRALRRRAWLVLLVALPVGMAGTVWTLRQPAVYRASAQVVIEPPQFDAYLGGLVGHSVARDAESTVKYVPNRLALLRSKALADRVVSDPALLRPGGDGDPAQELIGGLQTRQITGSNYFDVTIEGGDPARITRLLNTLLRVFSADADVDNLDAITKSRRYGETSLDSLREELAGVDFQIEKHIKGSPIFAPGGKNLLQDRYVALNSVLAQARSRHGDLRQQKKIRELMPNLRRSTAPSPHEAEVTRLLQDREKYAMQLAHMKQTVRNPNSDPGARYVMQFLASIDEKLRKLKAIPAEPTEVDTSAIAVASTEDEIRALDEEVHGLLVRLQDSMPEYQKYLTALGSREQLVGRIGAMQSRLSEFEMLIRSRKNPVQVVLPASEPTAPIRPNRPVLILMASLLGLALGGGLVVALEHLDHSVKAPEQLVGGLGLPLFGVVPRIRRTAKVHRGGHLWTPGAPTSAEADAYRNLRASLLGASGPQGVLTTLLVTSAKPGEGKSTTALNLAATCARAGERTLLMDVDLRRPSLAGVFGEAGADGCVGLVDVLHGDLPWQRALVRTDLPNLDFLPTGATGEVPIEVLGSLEVRQLLSAVAGHYDRVILDGPAVLGLADCRMLGRTVDAALMVVRCGAHDLRPLQRAKAMLEQSRVMIAGLIFNGLAEDLENWSSLGPSSGYAEAEPRPKSGSGRLPSPGRQAPATTVGSS